MSKLNKLAAKGQSVWFDYIRRAFIESGELQQLIDQGLRGITSNPTIFEKAITGSADYDAALRPLVETGKSVEEIYEALALEDISRAADLMRPVYEQTEGRDGFVSIEVSPLLANDTAGTIGEARRLFESLARPNIMIKVPATRAGIPAISELIGSGINVNVTLIFSLENYGKVANAYIAGLKKLGEHGPQVAGGVDLKRIASVASFFVSRIDTLFDRELKKREASELLGKTAVANAKLAYKRYLEIFRGMEWEHLAVKGARPQRLLWASTGTKNPIYPDTLYVDSLIGPGTVNTIPPATLTAFLDHGTVAETLQDGLEEAQHQMARLAELDVDYDRLTGQLQSDGVKAFADSFTALLQSIGQKCQALSRPVTAFAIKASNIQTAMETTLQQMQAEDIVHRVWGHDHTAWKPEPAEISNRLGWLHCPENMPEAIPEIGAFVAELQEEGFNQVLLLGMGGSSLAPEVFRKTFGVQDGYLNLRVLDSTDPDAVLAAAEWADAGKTLFLVSTKSGGTVETLSSMKYFYTRITATAGKDKAGRHFAAITDPGSGLEKLAGELRFRKIFRNDPNIGGRYSALSLFGLVPATLLGIDLKRLLDKAQTMACNCEGCNSPVGGNNTGARLGALMGEAARQGRDKITFFASPAIASFGAWVEQLIAESTGKEGKGILPVDGEPPLPAADYSADRLFVQLKLGDDSSHDAFFAELEKTGHPVVRIRLEDLYDLGGEFFRWEFATALSGWRLGINPFDQPNVESAKVAARQMVAAYSESGKLPRPEPLFSEGAVRVISDLPVKTLKEALDEFLAGAQPGRHYLALQAYLNPEKTTAEQLNQLRAKLLNRFRVATTLGFGPRFLHSTGQLHKGDGGNGLFLQIVSEGARDAAIPDQPGGKNSSISFGVLKNAQSLGDREALLAAGRKVLRLEISGDPLAGLRQISEALA